jgi:protein SCO1/2
MKEVRVRVAKKRGDGAVRFVSFSVDPETDTPPVLAAYATRVGAAWTFVTGPSDDVQKAVVQGFKITAQKTVNNAGERDVLHGNWFVVGDGQGRIRGYYQTDTDDDVEKIAHDVLRLVAEK